MTFPGQQIKKNELLFQAPVLNRCQDAVFASFMPLSGCPLDAGRLINCG
jgi:hypothetical protein